MIKTTPLNLQNKFGDFVFNIMLICSTIGNCNKQDAIIYSGTRNKIVKQGHSSLDDNFNAKNASN